MPNLFAVDEKQEICERMRVLDRQRERDKQTDGSPLSLFNMFLERCRTQLHVVLAMSPIGDAFRNRLRRFPALINCCTINWFQVGLCIYWVPVVPLMSSLDLPEYRQRINGVVDKGHQQHILWVMLICYLFPIKRWK